MNTSLIDPLELKVATLWIASTFFQLPLDAHIASLREVELAVIQALTAFMKF